MTALLLIRHGPTAWNAEKRLQGRADIPLSEAGLEQVSRWRLPEAFIAFDWWVSPLLRARQTAEALRLTAGVEPRLIEMDYGAFEGRTIAHLRRELGSEMTKNEDRGPRFHPARRREPAQGSGSPASDACGDPAADWRCHAQGGDPGADGARHRLGHDRQAPGQA